MASLFQAKPLPLPTNLLLGVDPGRVNLGAALVYANPGDWKVTIDKCWTENPSKAKSFEEFSSLFFANLQAKHFTMERFIPYNSVMSPETEGVTSLIGMLRLQFYLRSGGLVAELYKAIDWKMFLVKHLAKHHGFTNPSKSGKLDKEFSLSAAKFISTNPERIKNDHEADAVCLAAIQHFKTSIVGA